MPGELLSIDPGSDTGTGGLTTTRPDGSIDWKAVIASLTGGAARQRQPSQPGTLQTAQLPGQTVPVSQLQIPPLLGQEAKQQTSASDVDSYIKIIAALFGGGA